MIEVYDPKPLQVGIEAATIYVIFSERSDNTQRDRHILFVFWIQKEK